MHYAFDHMWNFFDFGENAQVSDVKLKFRKFRYSFGKNHSSRKVEFIKKANYIPAHTHKDQKIIDMIHDKSLTDDIHSGDEKILFDLHEFSDSHKDLDLILVSWDKTFINVVKILMEVLSFNKYIYLSTSKE